MSTHIPQTELVDQDIVRTLEVSEPDSDGDILLKVTEDGVEAELWLDAHGIAVLRNALGGVGGHPQGVPDENETLIAAAIVFERVIEFAYDKGSGVIEHRRLIPRVSYDAPNGIVITGDDQDRDDVRAFRLDRIQDSVRVV